MMNLKKYTTAAALVVLVTAGLSTVSAADVVNLSGGTSIILPPGVKAVSLDANMYLRTDVVEADSPETVAKRSVKRGARQLELANQHAAEVLNKMNIGGGKIKKKPFTGKIVDELKFYQLQGTNPQGHQTAALYSVALTKDFIDYAIQQESNKKMEAVGFVEPLELTSGYSYELAQLGLAVLPNKTATLAELGEINTAINSAIQESLVAVVDESLKSAGKIGSTKPGPLSEEDMTMFGTAIKKLIPLGLVDLTALSAGPRMTDHGLVLIVNMRGRLQYDGVRAPGALNVILEPTKTGVTVNYVIMNDTGYSYWNQQIEQMWLYKPLKGGK